MCFGGRKTRDERKLCLKIHLFGFPQRLVTGQSTTETHKMVSASTLIGPFEFDRALATRPLLTARSQVNNGRVASARSNSNGPIRVEAETILRVSVVDCPVTSLWGKPKRWILRQSFRSSRVFRPPKHTYLEWNLLGFMELLFLLRFGTFPVEEKTICGVRSGRRWMELPAFLLFQ